jgi:hypothetical protein
MTGHRHPLLRAASSLTKRRTGVQVVYDSCCGHWAAATVDTLRGSGLGAAAFMLVLAEASCCQQGIDPLASWQRRAKKDGLLGEVGWAGRADPS